MNPPILRVELEHMRQVFYTAFLDNQLQFDALFKQALDETLKPERLLVLLKAECEIAIKQYIKETVAHAINHSRDVRERLEMMVKSQVLTQIGTILQ